MRRALLLLMMAAGISLVVWSGYKNWHAAHRPALDQATHVTLIPDNVTPPSGPSDEAAIADSPLRGKPAPSFSLPDLSGKTVTLADFKGHPLLLNYWGTYCAPCKFEMPWLQEFSQKYAGDGLKVVGITYDSEVGKDTIAKDTQKLGVTYPILLSDSKAEKDYLTDLPALPVSFYVDKTGKIIEITAGLGSKDQLEAMVKKIIPAGAQ